MTKFKAIPAVYLILRNGDEVLLLQRSNTGYYDGDFSLPAGHADGGESLKHAALREANEELGISVKESELKLVHVLHRVSDAPDNSNERLDFFFECLSWDGKIINAEPKKCTALEWHTYNDLPMNVVPHVKSVLAYVAKNNNYSAIGW